MKRKFFYAVLFAFSAELVFAASPRNEKELIQPDSWVYDSLTALAVENGRVDFSDDAPLTVGQIRILMKAYDYDSLSESSKNHYDKINAYFDEQNISFSAGIFSLGIALETNLEGYYKGNANLPWIYDRNSRKEFLLVPATFDIGDYLTMQTNLSFAQSKGWMQHNDNYVNAPFPIQSFDVNFPSYGYISTGINLPKDCQVNLRLGLGEQSIGRTLMGSIIMSEYFTGASWVNLEFFSPNLKYELNVTEFNVDKYLYSHRIDVQFFNKIHFSAMEGILVHAPFELRFLNPWTIYHGMAPWLDYSGETYTDSDTCAYMCFKVAYTPVKYLRLYGLFAQDQFQTAYEIEHWPNDTTPNAIGFQAGVESFIPFKGGNFHIAAEGSYAEPFLYVKEDPNWSLVRTYRENMGDLATFYEWLGSPFGPDTVAGQLSVGYEYSDRWNVNMNYLFKAAGEYSGTKVFTPGLSWGGHDTEAKHDDDGTIRNWAFPNANDPDQGLAEAKRRQALKAPSGIPEYLNMISVNGSYKFNDYLSLFMQGGFIFAFNYNNILDNFQCGPEFAMSLKFDITKLYRNLMDKPKKTQADPTED